MTSLAARSPPPPPLPPLLASAGLPAEGRAAAQQPELSEADYLAEVLGSTTKLSQTEIDEELAAKARALGVSPSRPSSSSRLEPAYMSSALPQATPGAGRHARSESAASVGSVASRVAQYPRKAMSMETPAAGALSSKRSKSLTFSHYDKYLTQVDPVPQQPKSQPEERPSPSEPTSNRRLSIASIKKTLRRSMQWKPRSASTAGNTR